MSGMLYMILLAKDNSFHIYVISTQIPVYNIDMKSSLILGEN